MGDVAGKSSGERKRLVAYVVTSANEQPSPAELRRFLEEQLPAHMIPSTFVILDAMPRTANGKVDRQALPSAHRLRPDGGAPFVPPSTNLERRIAAVWQAVLEVDKIGVHDNFFDLGGHSLLMLRVQGKLRESLNIETTIVDLFRSPTVASLAKSIRLKKPVDDGNGFQQRAEKQQQVWGESKARNGRNSSNGQQ